MKLPAAGMSLDTDQLVFYLRQGYSIDDLACKSTFPSLPGFLNDMLGRKKISVEVASGLADINTATTYKIMKKQIAPSRNLLLRLAFALEMSFEETQILLKCGNTASLSASRKRDQYIMEGIIKKNNFDDVNTVLAEHGLPTLYSKG